MYRLALSLSYTTEAINSILNMAMNRKESEEGCVGNCGRGYLAKHSVSESQSVGTPQHNGPKWLEFSVEESHLQTSMENQSLW